MIHKYVIRHQSNGKIKSIQTHQFGNYQRNGKEFDITPLFYIFTRCMLLCSIINRGLFPHIKTLLMPDTEHSGFEGWYDAYQGISRATFHWRFFHRNSNSMKISFHSHLDSNTVIATKFCTWHDSCVLSWHVQKFVVIGWPATELWQGEVSIEFDLRAKKR